MEDISGGLRLTINIIVGYLTPPFGINLFYMKGLVPEDISMADIYASILPYVVISLIVLALSIAFPPILLWLPSMMVK